MQSCRLRFFSWVMLLATAAFAAAGPPVPARKVRISMELITDGKLPATSAQAWYNAAKDLGLAGLRIRTVEGEEKAEIEQVGSKAAPAYRVTGILTPENVLVVPGGKFSVRDTGKLRKWLDNLSDQGVDGVTQPKLMFGLLRAQGERFSGDLKKPIAFSTKGTPLAQAVKNIAGQLAFPLTLEPGCGAAMADVVVEDDLRGISRGTALAIMLRPAGLAFEPERQSGDKLQYRVRKADTKREAWPIGWKPSEPMQKILPESFNFINVDLSDITLPEVLDAIEGRLKAQFLFDHNALALVGIDPAKVEVNLPAKKLTYVMILNRVLSKARLRYELRVDDADRPFLWVTTIKPVP